MTKLPPPKEQHTSPSPRCAMQDVHADETNYGARLPFEGKYEQNRKEREGEKVFKCLNTR